VSQGLVWRRRPVLDVSLGEVCLGVNQDRARLPDSGVRLGDEDAMNRAPSNPGRVCDRCLR